MVRISSSEKFISSIRSILILGLILLNLPSSGQLNKGGIPPSFSEGVEPVVDMVMLERPDLYKIQVEDLHHPLPFRFAVNLPANCGIPGNGTWTRLRDGSSIWRLTVQASDALALSLYFDLFNLPEGGRLFLYDASKKFVLGAYTSENNRSTRLFATQLIPGDKVTLEYHHPPSSGQMPLLHLSEVAYAYRGVNTVIIGHPTGEAGPCEVNINCPEGNDWQSEKRGITRIHTRKFGSGYWCSGTLINNTKEDGTPYVLTADHCGQGATFEDYAFWVFYLGYESDLCPDSDPPAMTYSLTGATVKAAAGDVQQSGSDFLLLLLNDTIPGSFNPYFNGWNRKNDPSPSGVTIHHPQGDVMKVSTYTTPVSSGTWALPGVYTHWKVKWSATTNGHGVTEGGSSGSPLFDSNGAVIGNLTGGESSCDLINLTKPDYYGKLSYSWNSNGADSSKQLSYWLDPIGTGTETLNGIALETEQRRPVKNLEVFPNPFMADFWIRLPEYHGPLKARVAVADITGKMIRQENVTFSGPTHMFRFPELAPGIYFMKISYPGTEYHLKLVKR